MVARYRSMLILSSIIALILWIRSGFIIDPNLIQASARELSPASSSIIVDDSTDVGAFANLAIVDGNPSIAYFDRFNLHLKFVRAIDAVGTAWGASIIVDNTKYSGLYDSLAVVNGKPAIAYYNSLSKTLNYVRANDIDGLSWATPVTVDKNGNVGLYASLAVVNGHPAIAYQDGTDVNHGQLKFVRATDDNGSFWGAPIVLDNSGNPGWELSMKDVNGYPAIAYFNIGGTASLRYILASNSNGSAWNGSITIDSPINGTIPSMAVVDGNPAIAYGDASSSANGHLKYVRANNSTGTSWGTPLIVDMNGNVGYFPWLAVINGFPAIGYTDNTSHNMNYVQATDPVGSQWRQPIIVDSGQFDVYPSLASVNGEPGIAYEDESGGGSLRFIIPAIPLQDELFLPFIKR